MVNFNFLEKSLGIVSLSHCVHDFSIKIFLMLIFHGRGLYHIETSPLICSANQWTSFYMITTSVIKELMAKWRNAQRKLDAKNPKLSSFFTSKMFLYLFTSSLLKLKNLKKNFKIFRIKKGSRPETKNCWTVSGWQLDKIW